MPFTFDGTSLPVESQIAPEQLEEFKKWQQQQAKQQQAPAPQEGGGATKPQAEAPKPQAAKPQQQGPGAPGGMNGVQKWVEENIAIPATDFVDNTFKGDQQTPDEIARQRAEQRIEFQRAQIETQRGFDAQPGAMFFGEGVRALAGGAEDLVEGAVNLAPQATNFAFGTDLKPVNFGIVRENSTTVGKGMRTLSRYVMSGLGVGAITRGGLGAGLTGGLGFAARGAQGFIEDFIAADGTAEDGTLIGNTEFTKMLQTSDANDPMVNRAIVGLEGALFEAVGAPAVQALWKVVGGSKAISKLDEVARGWSKASARKKIDKLFSDIAVSEGLASPIGNGPFLDAFTKATAPIEAGFDALDTTLRNGSPWMRKAYGVLLGEDIPVDEVEELLAETRRMLTDPQVLRDQKRARLVAETHRAIREARAADLAKKAQARLKLTLMTNFAQDSFEGTLDYTKVTERDLALRLIQEDPSRMKLNQLIAEAAGTVDETDPILQYLRARADAYEASKYLDDVANTVKYGGDPDERVFDVTRLPEIQDEIGRIDAETADFSANLAKADEGLAQADELINNEAALGGQLNLQIADLTSKLDSFPTAEEIAKQSSVKLSLSKAQVDRINSLTLPEGVTISPGRRVQGLTADNIDDFRASVAELAASGDKVAKNLSTRLDDLQLPDVEAVGRYSAGEGYGVNAALRGQADMTPKMKESVNQLDSYISRTPLEQGTYYRGLPEGSYVRDLQPGDTFTDKAFLSVSRERGMAEEFGKGVVLEIDGKAAPMGGAGNSEFEQELLFPRGTKLEVVSVSDQGGTRVIKMKQVGEGKANFQSREAIQAQLDDLVARRNDIFGKQVESRQQQMVAKAERDKLSASVERLTVEKQAITAKLSGREADFTADYVPVKLDRSNVTSIVKEGGGGQPGFDLYFEDKRFPALLDGRVKEIGRQGGNGSGYGNYIVVESIDPKTGQTVDVLYAHLEDGSIKVKEGDMVGTGQQIAKQGGTGRVVSQDGTIASVDFLAPAAKGSKSMTPYGRWSELVDELSLSIHKGELQPSQVGRKAPSVMPEVVEGAARRADELVPAMSRAEAVTEAGYNVDQVAPVQPRSNIVDDFIDDTEPVVGTAAPGKASLTDMDVYSLSQGEQGLAILENTVADIERRVIYTEAQTIEKLPEAVDMAKEFLGADDASFLKLIEDEKFLSIVDGNKLFTTEGLAANGMVLKELQRQAIDLSESVIRNTVDGSPQAGQDAARLLDRMMAMLNVRTLSKQTASGKLREFDYIGRNLPDVNGQPQVASPYLKKMQEDLQNQLAKEENLYQSFAQLRTRLASGDKAAFRELERAAKVMQVMQPTQKNFRAVQTALASVGKGLDSLYVNSILSGPVTMSRNFWGNFYQTIGHPMQALLGSALPGKHNAKVRAQAIAALGSLWDSRTEFLDTMARMTKKQWNMMGPDAKEYVIWDETLAANMAALQQKIDAGEVGWFTSQIYGLGINLRKIADSPMMRPMMAFMGATDNYFKVMAARQVAAKRAVEYALDALGDAPMTAKRSQKFGELVAEFKELELKKILSDDGMEVIDEEAIKLGQTFTFQTPIDEADLITRKLNELSSVPGMKFLGLTFVKTPSNILKSAANLTPGLSTLLKNTDAAYKNGDAYYRAVRDGAEAMSYILGGAAMAGGLTGTITGAGPLRGDDRDLWLQNHKPFTITIGGMEFNYQAIEPASSVVGMFADMGALAVSDDEDGNFLPSVAAIVMSNIVNKSYLAQISTVASLVNAQDPRELTKVFENMGRGLVPYSGARSQWGQIIDPAQREVRSQLEDMWSWALKKHVGLGSTKALPQRVDPVTGEELTKDGIDGIGGSLMGLTNMLVGGLRVSKNRFKPVHKAMEAEGYDITNKTKELAGEILRNEQMVEYNKLRAAGGGLEKELLAYFKSDQYLKIDKPQSEYQRQNGMEAAQTDAYKVIDTIVKRYHNIAVGTMEAGLNAPTLEWSQRVQQLNQKRQQIDAVGGQRRSDFLYGTQQPQEILQNYQY